MAVFLTSSAAPDSRMTHSRRLDRSTDELIGLCRGILADGAINISEARFLDEWLRRHAEFATSYPFNVLVERLHDALKDGVFEPEEEAQLLEALSKLVGGETQHEESGAHSLSCALPLDDPAPAIVYPDHAFAVTGVFVYGSRARVALAIAERGADLKSTMSGKVDYLVIGDVGSRDWVHSSFGRKIEEAVALKEDGSGVAIICERHWTESLK